MLHIEPWDLVTKITGSCFFEWFLEVPVKNCVGYIYPAGGFSSTNAVPRQRRNRTGCGGIFSVKESRDLLRSRLEIFIELITLLKSRFRGGKTAKGAVSFSFFDTKVWLRINSKTDHRQLVHIAALKPRRGMLITYCRVHGFIYSSVWRYWPRDLYIYRFRLFIWLRTTPKMKYLLVFHPDLAEQIRTIFENFRQTCNSPLLFPQKYDRIRQLYRAIGTLTEWPTLWTKKVMKEQWNNARSRLFLRA